MSKQSAYFIVILAVIAFDWRIQAKEGGLKFESIEYADEFTKEELKLLDLTNQVRAKHKLKPLAMNKELADVARIQSNDMARHHHLSHTVKGKHLKDRITKSGYNYRIVGENIAMSKGTAKHVISMWMKSPRHRKNILSAHYKELGVGITKANNGNKYFTQIFGAHR